MPSFPINIALIDDDIDFCRNLAEDAKKHRIIISYSRSLEEASALIRKNRKILIVILDTRCLLEKDQPQSQARSNFIIHAINEINDIEKDTGRIIPFCFVADKPEEFTEDLDGVAEIFNKQQDKNNLFQHLIDTANTLPEFIVREQNTLLFDIFDNFFSQQEEELITDLLININKTDYSSIVSNLSIIRRLDESLFDFAALKILNKDPGIFNRKGASRTRGIVRELIKINKFSFLQRDMADMIYTVCSRFGSHTFDENFSDNKFKPTSNTVKAMFFIYHELLNHLSNDF